MLIVAGRNIDARELDALVTSHPACRPGNAACVPDGSGRYVVVAEPRAEEMDLAELRAGAREIRVSLARRFGASPSEVVFIARGTLPKTPSGKVRRNHLSTLWAGGGLARGRVGLNRRRPLRSLNPPRHDPDTVGRIPGMGSPGSADCGREMQTGNTRTDVMSLDEFKAWFVAEIDWSPAEISEEDDLVEDLGMDSVGAVDLMAAIEEAVGGDVIMPIELLLQITTVRDAYLQYCALSHLPYESDRPQ